MPAAQLRKAALPGTGLWLEMLTQGLGTMLLPGAIAFDGALSALFLVTLARGPAEAS